MTKKFQLKDLFDSYAQFCKAVPGADTSADLDSLQGAAVTARKRIVSMVGNAVFNDIVGLGEDADFFKDMLRSAVANLTLANQLIFDAVARRKGGVDLYKYGRHAPFLYGELLQCDGLAHFRAGSRTLRHVFLPGAKTCFGRLEKDQLLQALGEMQGG